MMSGPKAIDAPLLLGVCPGVGEGSAQRRSHMRPFSGGSANLKVSLISLIVTPSYEGSPPWQIITLSLITYERGSAQKNSEKAS